MRSALRRPCVLLVALFAAGGASGCGYTGDETLVLFPSAASYDAEAKAWSAQVNGWVYQPRGWSFVRDLGFSMLADDVPDDERAAVREVYERRVSSFIVDGRSGRQVVIVVGDERFTTPPTDSAGRFSHAIKLPEALVVGHGVSGELPIRGYLADALPARVAEAVGEATEAVVEKTKEALAGDAPPDAAEVPDDKPDSEAIAADADTDPKGPPPAAEGVVRLIPVDGWSVISDVDDTIRLSHVSDKAKMVRFMLLFEYEPVPGMAEAYAAWAQDGAAFHYVSASPSQLFAEFRAFAGVHGFPAGTFHMKRVGWFDSYMSNLWASSTAVKPRVIHGLINDFPGRRFVLVGDSTEHDATIYAEAYRKYPERVAMIYIRDVAGDADEADYAEVFADVPREKWALFTDPSELRPLPMGEWAATRE